MILVKSDPALEMSLEAMPEAEIQESMKKMVASEVEIRALGR